MLFMAISHILEAAFTPSVASDRRGVLRALRGLLSRLLVWGVPTLEAGLRCASEETLPSRPVGLALRLLLGVLLVLTLGDAAVGCLLRARTPSSCTATHFR